MFWVLWCLSAACLDSLPCFQACLHWSPLLSHSTPWMLWVLWPALISHLSPTSLPDVSHRILDFLRAWNSSLSPTYLHLPPTCAPVHFGCSVLWSAWFCICFPATTLCILCLRDFRLVSHLSPSADLRNFVRMILRSSPTCLLLHSAFFDRVISHVSPTRLHLSPNALWMLWALSPSWFRHLSPTTLCPHNFRLVLHLSPSPLWILDAVVRAISHLSPAPLSHYTGFLYPHDFTLAPNFSPNTLCSASHDSTLVSDLSTLVSPSPNAMGRFALSAVPPPPPTTFNSPPPDFAGSDLKYHESRLIYKRTVWGQRGKRTGPGPIRFALRRLARRPLFLKTKPQKHCACAVILYSPVEPTLLPVVVAVVVVVWLVEAVVD